MRTLLVLILGLCAPLAGGVRAASEMSPRSDFETFRAQESLHRGDFSLAPYLWLPVDALDPYLKYPPLELPLRGNTEPAGPQVAVLVVSLDATHPGKQIFATSFSIPGGLYGFDGATGAPLAGFSPATRTGPWAGISLTTAIPVGPGASGNPNGLPALPDYYLFDEHGTGTTESSLATMRLLDGAGQTLWNRWPSNVQFGPMRSPATAYGTLAADGSEDAVFLIDEETFASHGRSARTGAVLWQSDDAAPYDQQITSAAVMDVASGPSQAAFVFCRGFASCLLEKHKVSDGTLLWKHDLGSNHIYPFVAVGNMDGAPGDEVVVVGRQNATPWHATLQVIDGNNGAIRWTFSLGEAASWGPAPVLADIDADGSPEVLVQTNTQLHAVKFLSGELPSWPITTSTVPTLPQRSEAVVGDLDGNGKMDIAIVSWNFSPSAYGVLDIFDHEGQRNLFPGSVLMPVGAGQTPAIADVDGDGHNELILGSSINYGWPMNVVGPALWVLDFSRDRPDIKHGAILWSQFGGDAQHTARALAANAEIAVSPTLISAIAVQGQSATARLAIGNRGAGDLSWRLLEDGSDPERCPNGSPPPWLMLATDSGRLPGGHDDVLDVALDASQLPLGRHSATLCISSNDFSHGTLAIPVQLDVVSDGHIVSTVRNRGGQILPVAPQFVAAGARARFQLNPERGYMIGSVSGCGGTLVGNEFITAPIAQDCRVVVAFQSVEFIFTDGFD